MSKKREFQVHLNDLDIIYLDRAVVRRHCLSRQEAFLALIEWRMLVPRPPTSRLELQEWLKVRLACWIPYEGPLDEGKSTHVFKFWLDSPERQFFYRIVKKHGISEAAVVRHLLREEEAELLNLSRGNSEMTKAVEDEFRLRGAPVPPRVEPTKEVLVGHWQGHEWWRTACPPDERGCFSVRWNKELVDCYLCHTITRRPPESERPPSKYAGEALAALPAGKWEVSGKHWRLACGHTSPPAIEAWHVCRVCKAPSRRPEESHAAHHS